MEFKRIEKFFLSIVLKIILVGVSVILITDIVLYPQDSISLALDVCILLASIASYLIRNRWPILSLLTISIITLAAMIYQCLAVPFNTTTSITVILVLGFIYSILLRGRLLWIMHAITYSSILSIFVIQIITPSLSFSKQTGEVLSIVITYSVLYFILAYATGVLKFQYDKTHSHLKSLNAELHEKAIEIESQNEELLQIQNSLSAMNGELERMVNERTQSLKIKTRKLIRYSFANAHHLRGPIARLLGLVEIQKLEENPDNAFFFEKIKEQALEIDTVVQQINVELTEQDIAEEDAGII